MQLGQRLATGLLGHQQGFPLGLLFGPQEPPDPADVQGHRGHAAGHDVVQLTRDPGPLPVDGDLGLPSGLPFGLRGPLFGQLGAELPNAQRVPASHTPPTYIPAYSRSAGEGPFSISTATQARPTAMGRTAIGCRA